MRIICCYKLVVDEQDIRINPDRSLSFDGAQWKIGLYDLNAVEAGKQLAEATGGTLTALSAGGDILQNSKLKKAILSRGPDALFIVRDGALEDAGTHLATCALAGAIHKLGPFDLVLCGEGSADLYAGQVGPQLGQILGLPVLNAVCRIEPAAGGGLRVERALEDEVEIHEIDLPAVVCVTSDINVPRIPGMKEILAAGRKPAIEWTLADLGLAGGPPAVEIVATLAPEQVDRKRIILEGEDAVNEIFQQICK